MVAPPVIRNRYILSAQSPSTGSNTAYHSKLGTFSVVNTYEFVKPTPRRHMQRTSWNHWQLRDVVLCPTAKQELYSIYRCNVDKYDIRKQQSTRILGELEFDPVSMAVGGDFIVVGGQRAELAVARLSDPCSMTIVRSGGSINNFVALDQQQPAIPRRRFRDSAAFVEDGVTNLNIMSSQSMPRLLVCNNDHTVRLLSLPGLDLITELKFPTAVNYAAVSPDGTKMCVVGDSNLVFLFNKRGDDFEKIATLTASEDASFSCDFNQSSELFAVGSQDGYVTVWDIRSQQQKLVQLETFQHGRSRGACRNVKFSPSGSVDLLAFSEHSSFVNIADTRCFEKRQILRVGGGNEEVVPPPDSPTLVDQDYQITGLRFAYDSSALFVGLEGSILEYSVDRISRHSFPSSAII
ncbi:hypothetical protein GGH94_005170 [Coemansia aciculifera]|uniref:DUF2415 domain-containing protein n=1 Tax=Coemansia aciculifera TaxID=417176 RepID=A0A9W8IIZ5_9FUNG|nr:hypothetical protein GGH94_005170 [Coemansia aciculifera]